MIDEALKILQEQEKAEKTKGGIILVDGVEGEFIYANVISVGNGLLLKLEIEYQ